MRIEGTEERDTLSRNVVSASPNEGGVFVNNNTVVKKNSVSFVVWLFLTFCSMVWPVPAASAAELSLPGTLWGINDSYWQFLDTPVKSRNDGLWQEAFHYSRHGSTMDDKYPYIWRMEDSKIYLRDKKSSDRWDNVIGQIVDETTIHFNVYNYDDGKNTQKIVSEYDVTRVYTPSVLKLLDMAPLPPEQVWNLNRSDFSLNRTLWKYQADNGDNYVLYIRFVDDKHSLAFRTFTEERISWRQQDKKVSFSMDAWHSEDDDNDYEGQFIDWATIKGTYRTRNASGAGGKPIGFKLFRVIDPTVLGKYVVGEFSWQPQFSDTYKVLINNPNNYSVVTTVRNISPDSTYTGREITWNVPPNSSKAQRFPNGKYEIFFKYSNKPKEKYQGDSFSISGGDVEIKLVSVAGGNYGIRRVD